MNRLNTARASYIKLILMKLEYDIYAAVKQTDKLGQKKAKNKLNSLYRYLILDRYTQHKVIQKQDEKNSSCR
jgi:hypothetical protein